VSNKLCQAWFYKEHSHYAFSHTLYQTNRGNETNYGYQNNSTNRNCFVRVMNYHNITR